MPSIIEDELGIALARIAEEFKLRGAVERDYRAASFYIAIETLRVQWQAGLFAGESLTVGDRR